MDAMTGMIFTVPYNWAPNGWLNCQGQVLSINQYQALYSLIGNSFGGSMNQGSFALPDLRGRTQIGIGQFPGSPTNYGIGTTVGSETTTLGLNNLPPHNHGATFSPVTGSQAVTIPAQTGTLKVQVNASTGTPSTGTPSSSVVLANTGLSPKFYGGATAMTALADAAATVSGNASTAAQNVNISTVTGGTVAIAVTGSGQAFTNLQPSMALNFIITMTGIYPSRP
ncbi:hypothetical protein DK419_04865 [Methylobacterium terrae]|uniref:Phage tail collar domain-containing protein n=1 Tax=Methylobacterium terrae TaxID=2202827 RepID=A0A2U8WK05_9HYPH|nr:tail fiber protein [Methylobacterium terrae]AWN45730.1 hypothetical protein DK419_04865 [Methylobacterium terrae]